MWLFAENGHMIILQREKHMENFNTKNSHACLSTKWVLSELAYEYERILWLDEALLRGIAGAQ